MNPNDLSPSYLNQTLDLANLRSLSMLSDSNTIAQSTPGSLPEGNINAFASALLNQALEDEQRKTQKINQAIAAAQFGPFHSGMLSQTNDSSNSIARFLQTVPVTTSPMHQLHQSLNFATGHNTSDLIRAAVSIPGQAEITPPPDAGTVIQSPNPSYLVGGNNNLNNNTSESFVASQDLLDTAIETLSTAIKRTKTGPLTFPQKLHQLLLDLEEKEGGTEIASFCSRGRAFSIHKPKEFVADVMPKYFRMSCFPSFQRQLNLYSFKRISHGPYGGGYYHENFVKQLPMLCLEMQRKKSKRRKRNVKCKVEEVEE